MSCTCLPQLDWRSRIIWILFSNVDSGSSPERQIGDNWNFAGFYINFPIFLAIWKFLEIICEKIAKISPRIYHSFTIAFEILDFKQFYFINWNTARWVFCWLFSSWKKSERKRILLKIWIPSQAEEDTSGKIPRN